MRLANLGKRPLPRPRRKIYLAGAGESAAIGDLHSGRRGPPMFALALVGPLTNAAQDVAIVEVCRPALTESPVLAAADKGSRVEDCAKSGPRPFKIHLNEHTAGRSGRVCLSDHLE